MIYLYISIILFVIFVIIVFFYIKKAKNEMEKNKLMNNFIFKIEQFIAANMYEDAYKELLNYAVLLKNNLSDLRDTEKFLQEKIKEKNARKLE